MSDLIYRDEAIKTITSHNGVVDKSVAKRLLLQMKSAQPRQKGKWIERDDCWDGIYYECSVCKDSFTLIDGNPSDNNYNFCPSCGSYNGGEEDE